MQTLKYTLLQDVCRHRNYTLNIAEAMPENLYGYTPPSGLKSFKELIHYMACSMVWASEHYILGVTGGKDLSPALPCKDAIIAFLKRTWSIIDDDIRCIKEWNACAVRAVYMLFELITHLSGQAIVYLECCGVPVPEWTPYTVF